MTSHPEPPLFLAWNCADSAQTVITPMAELHSRAGVYVPPTLNSRESVAIVGCQEDLGTVALTCLLAV